jgi:hypothetical protein
MAAAWPGTSGGGGGGGGSPLHVAARRGDDEAVRLLLSPFHTSALDFSAAPEVSADPNRCACLPG